MRKCFISEVLFALRNAKVIAESKSVGKSSNVRLLYHETSRLFQERKEAIRQTLKAMP